MAPSGGPTRAQPGWCPSTPGRSACTRRFAGRRRVVCLRSISCRPRTAGSHRAVRRPVRAVGPLPVGPPDPMTLHIRPELCGTDAATWRQHVEGGTTLRSTAGQRAERCPSTRPSISVSLWTNSRRNSGWAPTSWRRRPVTTSLWPGWAEHRRPHRTHSRAAGTDRRADRRCHEQHPNLALSSASGWASNPSPGQNFHTTNRESIQSHLGFHHAFDKLGRFAGFNLGSPDTGVRRA